MGNEVDRARCAPLSLQLLLQLGEEAPVGALGDELLRVRLGVPGAIAGKFTVSGITEKLLLLAPALFISKNKAVEARCCMY